jgi:aldose 1-epimerase
VTATATAATVKIAPYGVTQAGEKVTAFTLINDRGASATVLDYGGTIAAIRVPDRQGQFANVVMSFADMTGWETPGHWTNADIGRYSNIIRNGFTLDGVHYPLAADARGVTMHSGPATYARRMWIADPIHPKDGASLTLTMDSPDGDQGFPGHATIKVTYQLNNKDELRLDFVATTDKPTVINLTNHLYLNLDGNSTIPVYDHDLQVMTDQAAVQESGKGPTGVIQSVVGTPFDFTKPTVIKERLAISLGPQYDNAITAPPIPSGMARSFNEPFVLHDGDNRLDRIAARLHDPVSGRVLELRTTELTVHVFTPAAIEAGLLSDAGKPFTRVPSIALETQHLPDSPNHPEFPSTVLRPGQTFRSTTIFAFTTDVKK